jgi:hypothetical protein
VKALRIKIEWIKRYFRVSGRPNGEDDEVKLDSATVTKWLRDAERRRSDPARPDNPDELIARLQELRARSSHRA